MASIEVISTQRRMLGAHGPVRARRRRDRSQHRLVYRIAPRPVVAEPKLRDKMQLSPLRAAISRDHSDMYLFRGSLGVAHFHVEIPVLAECAGIEQRKRRLLTR